MTTTAKKRTRRISVPQKDDLPVEITQLARAYHLENTEKNSWSSKANKTRKTLHGAMLDAKRKEAVVTTEIEGKSVTFDVKVAIPDVTHIDLAKLKELVGEEKFMEIVSATKKAIETHAGAAVFNQVSKVKKGTDKTKEAVSVKLRK